jgi:hypothetical protein
MATTGINYVVVGKKHQMFLSLWRDYAQLVEWLTKRNSVSDLSIWTCPDNPYDEINPGLSNTPGYRVCFDFVVRDGVIYEIGDDGRMMGVL